MSTQTKTNPYTEQVMRLSSLKKFPLYPQGITELRDALRKNAGTMDRAMRVIDKVIGEHEICPTPRELAGIAQEVIRASEAAPMGCDLCQGHPWITVEVVVKDQFTGERGQPPKEMTRMGSKRCDCSKGRWFQQKDRENNEKRALGLPV